MTIKVTQKKLEQSLETYAGLVEAFPDNEAYLQRYAEMLQALGREATATLTLQHLHDVIASRSTEEAKAFAKKHPQIGRISLDEIFDGQDKHIIAGQIIYELLGKIWLRLHQRKLREGQVVCRADELSDSLILVLKGRVDIYAPDASNNRVLLESVGISDVLGEQTYFAPNAMHFDAFASSDSTIIVNVPRSKISTMIASNAHLEDMLKQRVQFRKHVRMIALHPIFKTLPLKLSKYLARYITQHNFPEQSIILSLKDKVDGIHIITSGKASYLAEARIGKKFALAPLRIGTLVGNLLLQKNQPHSNELFALTPVSTLFMPNEQLLNISTAFPPLMERLMQHAEQQQQLIIRSLAEQKHG